MLHDCLDTFATDSEQFRLKPIRHPHPAGFPNTIESSMNVGLSSHHRQSGRKNSSIASAMMMGSVAAIHAFAPRTLRLLSRAGESRPSSDEGRPVSHTAATVSEGPAPVGDRGTGTVRIEESGASRPGE